MKCPKDQDEAFEEMAILYEAVVSEHFASRSSVTCVA